MEGYFNKITVVNEADDREIESIEVSCDEKKNFINTFKEYIDIAKSKGGKLVVEFYEGIQGNIDALTALKEKEIDFHIKNFPALTPRFVPVLIEHLKLAKDAKSNKIRESITRRRNIGQTIGNPNIANIAQDLGLKQRIKNSLFDERNLRAKKWIIVLKKKGLSDNAIAKALEKKDIRTRRGKHFYQKSVQRLYNRYKRLKEDFEFNTTIYNHLNGGGGPAKSILKDFKEGQNFEDSVELNFKTVPCTIKIYNHKGEFVLLYSIYEEGKWLLSIGETIELMPGLHYFQLYSEDGKEQLYASYFKVKESLVQGID